MLCDADNVRPRHKLAEAYDFGKFLLAYPRALIDGDPARPDEPAGETAERDGEERNEQRCQRTALRAFPICPRRRSTPDLGMVAEILLRLRCD
jgi:hypothetical protein